MLHEEVALYEKLTGRNANDVSVTKIGAYLDGYEKGIEVLDKIRAEIEQTRKMYLDMNDIDWLNGCDYVLSVIDKYKGESEEETETWNGIHAQITAPKGTFDKIFNDTEEDIDDI